MILELAMRSLLELAMRSLPSGHRVLLTAVHRSFQKHWIRAQLASLLRATAAGVGYSWQWTARVSPSGPWRYGPCLQQHRKLDARYMLLHSMCRRFQA